MKRYIEGLEREEKELEEQLKEIDKRLRNFKGFKALFSIASIIKLIQKKEEILLKLIDVKDRKWDALSNNHATLHFKSILWQIDRLSATYEDVRTLLLEFNEIGETLRKLKNGEKIEESEKEEILSIIELADYSSFERRFRKEEELKKSLKSYIKYFPENGLILDLGCGRGEFLEVLEKNGRFGIGVDIDDGMVKIAKRKGLKVYKDDLLTFLEKREDNSLDGIFSSQVIEHLKYSEIKKLINLSYKKLKNGGTLIFETVNPLSWFSFSQIFLLDPTHKTAVHPELMRFLFEKNGFSSVEIIFSVPPDIKLKETEDSTMNYNIDLLNKYLFSETNFAIKGKK